MRTHCQRHDDADDDRGPLERGQVGLVADVPSRREGFVLSSLVDGHERVRKGSIAITRVAVVLADLA